MSKKKLPVGVTWIAMAGGLAVQYGVLRQVAGIPPKKAVYVMAITAVISFGLSFVIAASVLADDEEGPKPLVIAGDPRPSGETASLNFGAYA